MYIRIVTFYSAKKRKEKERGRRREKRRGLLVAF